VQWENLRKMPFSTWKKSHFCDNPKQSCMTNDTHRFLFRYFLCFVCLELVIHDKKSWNMLGAPAELFKSIWVVCRKVLCGLKMFVICILQSNNLFNYLDTCKTKKRVFTNISILVT
jgi:hypothetical protein